MVYWYTLVDSLNPDATALDPGADQGDCDGRYEGELREQVMIHNMKVDNSLATLHNVSDVGSLSSYCQCGSNHEEKYSKEWKGL